MINGSDFTEQTECSVLEMGISGVIMHVISCTLRVVHKDVMRLRLANKDVKKRS